jgi:peptide/nickel transport system substrate-binding protein
MWSWRNSDVRCGQMRWIVVALAATVTLGAGCSPTVTSTGSGAPATERPQPQRQTGGELVVGLAAETDSFNPSAGQWSPTAYLEANAFLEPLAAIGANGIAHPYLAESILPNETLTEWTIRVRHGVSFHNGEPLDSGAVKKNLDASRSSGLTKQVLTTVIGVDVIDPLTVRVRTSQPWSTFPATLSVQTGYMVAPAMLDDPAGANAEPIGTGPFQFQKRVRDAFLQVTRNPNYWQRDRLGNQLPYLDSIKFQVLTDGASRTAAFASGDILAMDLTTPPAFQQAAAASERGELQLVSDARAEGDESILAMNTAREPFDDPLARQALAHGLDQEELATATGNSSFPPAWGMFEPGSPYYISKEEAGYPVHDLAKAADLARQYQQKHGKPISFTFLIPPDPSFIALGQALQAQVASFGVKVDVVAVELATLISRVIGGDYQGSGFKLFSSPSPDAGYLFLASQANASGPSLNYSRFNDAELTAAMDEFRSVTDPTKRIEAIKRVQRSLAKNLQVLFLVHARLGVAYANSIHGMEDATFPGTDAQAYTPFASTPFWTMVWKEQAG